MVSWKRYRPSATSVPSRHAEARRHAADRPTALPARMRRGIRRAGLIICVTVAAAGCRRTQPGPDSAADSAFVGALGDLRRAVLPGGAETTRDSAGRAIVRDSILRKYRVTEASLEETARRLAQHPEQASQILHAIDRHVQLAMGSAPPRPAGGAPAGGILRPGPPPPATQTPGLSGSASAATPNPAATAQSNADARALLNTLRAQSVAGGQKLPPSAGAGPPR